MATPQLDHIVILLPYADIVTPPKWITDHFTISPGGRHGDNKTENKLIVFQDGSYLELIAFIDDDPKHREGHWWGDKGWGIVDFAFTLADGSAAFYKIQEIFQKLDIPETWKPQELRGGSRIKPDGELIEWQVAFPKGNVRGRAPFWCFDVTPREKRVAIDLKLTTHPSGALGVASIFIDLEETVAVDVRKMLNSLLPTSNKPAWDLGTVKTLKGLGGSQIKILKTSEGDLKISQEHERILKARLVLWTDKMPPVGELRRNIEGDDLIFTFDGPWSLRE